MKHTVELPVLAYLNHLFTCDAQSGTLTWNINGDRSRVHAEGKEAGTFSSRYMRVYINRKGYALHRLIWKMVHGKDPSGVIDHIDGNTRNNKISNLREATQSENLQNRIISSNSTTGFKGVYYDKRRNHYLATYVKNGVRFQSNAYSTAEEADLVLRKLRADNDGEFACNSYRELAS